VSPQRNSAISATHFDLHSTQIGHSQRHSWQLSPHQHLALDTTQVADSTPPDRSLNTTNLSALTARSRGLNATQIAASPPISCVA